MHRRTLLAAAAASALAPGAARAQAPSLSSFALPKDGYPHDVAPGPDGIVWYSGQKLGVLGRLDPRTGETRHIPLGEGAAPHGVLMGGDGAVWITEGGQNAIARYAPASGELKLWKLPEQTGYANLNTLTFDQRGRVWFTGQAGFHGVLTPATGELRVFRSPRGRGPYGITTTPDGRVFYASLAGSHIAEVDLDSGASRIIEPPTPRQGARRIWSDSRGLLWVSEWNAGQLSVHDPRANSWRSWKLPGAATPQCYAVYVDEHDRPWVTDWGNNAILRFDPRSEQFASVALPRRNGRIRQIGGRRGEVWFGESATDHIDMAAT